MSKTAEYKTDPSFDDAPPPAANDNDKAAAESIAKLRDAIDAPSKAEVTKLIRDEIMSFHFMNRIELKKDDVVKELKDEPRHYLFPEILQTVNANLPAALIGPAGSGKSTVCEQIAVALDLKYYLQNSVSGTHELSGYMDAHGKYHGTTFRTAFEKGGLILIDEVDTSDPGALKWLNTALANGHAMFPDHDEPVRRHADFRMIIAANTFGNGADRIYVGANQLDASTLDRFVFFDFGYDEKLEEIVSGNFSWTKRVQKLRKAAQKEKARVVISPRASIYGAKLLATGWQQPVVEDRLIWKGMDPELRKRIEKAA
jgi:cobaltochelatase CobS